MANSLRDTSPPAIEDAINCLKASIQFASPSLTAEALEAGLRLLDRGDVDDRAFWERNVGAFREAVLVAICDTSDLLASRHIPQVWREELESQVKALHQYIAVADAYLADRTPPRTRLH